MKQYTVSLRPIEGGTAEVTVLRQGSPDPAWYARWSARAIRLGYSIEVALTESCLLESIEEEILRKETKR